MQEDKISQLTNGELSNQVDLYELKKSLEELKITLKNEDADGKDKLLPDLLSLLTEKISIIANEREKDISSYENQEIFDLMSEVAKTIQISMSGSIDETPYDELKVLLSELMYSVLADKGREENEAEVVGLAEEASNFYGNIGLGGIYNYILTRTG